MGTEDLIDVPASCNSGCKSENDNLRNSNSGPCDADSPPSNSEAKEENLNGKISATAEVDVGNGASKLFLAANMDGDLIGTSSVFQTSVELNDIVAIAEDGKCFSSGIRADNACVTVRDANPISSSQKRAGSPISNHEIDDSLMSVVKEARRPVDEQQRSVRVKYNRLTRDSKQRLEELLQQWSEWHAQHCSSSYDSPERLESGEETFFPALRVGLDNPSSVSFWMDNQTRNQKTREFIALDSKSVPLYDRGYSLEGGLEIIDASRCFNCGSYNHSLKECPKPRDNKAVCKARKQHKSRHNQNASSRNPIRYYQNSLGGKYDSLRPGVLDAETRQLLGLGELDPPPWLNRMREIGYPPGYLDANDEPSGITIFADEESTGGKEDGEILETPEPVKKTSVEFSGINAPIPENADERRWAAVPSSFNLSRDRSPHVLKDSSELISRGQHQEHRWSRDLRDEGPPSYDPGFSPTYPSYPRRYGGYDSSYTTTHYAGSHIPTPRRHSFGRTSSERGRWSPLVHEGSSNPGSHSSVSYSLPGVLFSPPSYGSASSENRDSDSWNAFNPNFLSHHKDKHHHHHHHHHHHRRR